jgi:hypothetical protein
MVIGWNLGSFFHQKKHQKKHEIGAAHIAANLGIWGRQVVIFHGNLMNSVVILLGYSWDEKLRFTWDVLGI